MEEQRNGLLLLAWATCFLLACLFAGCAGDVPDGVVYTDLHKTVRKGDSATLKCEFRGEPIAVYWRKEIGKGQWTDLITWVEGTMLPGSCMADDSCEMNQNYSLVINNVQIADRGRYMCRISNYLGILINNYTDVTVYAPPEEPYPIINECTSAENSTSSQECRIPTNNASVDITCSASSYFPELNLFFLHGSVRISNTDSKEWTNEDGTKNKSISIKGSGSDIPYVCVASGIPGSTEERTGTVFLLTASTPSAPDRSSVPSQTTMANVGRTDEAVGARPAKIAVPIIIIALAAGGTLLIVCCWLKRRRSAPASGENDIEEAQPMVQTIKVHVKGMFSYYELWSLAYNTPKQDMGKVCGALKELDIMDMETSTEEMRREHVYGVLCQWKEKTKKLNQAQIFRDALGSVELGNRWQQIYEKRQQTSTSVSEGTLQQILLDLGSSKTIKRFCDKLISKEETSVDSIKEKEAIAPNRELNSDEAEEKSKFNFKAMLKSKSKFNKLLPETKPNVGDEDDQSDDDSDVENNDEVSEGENKNDMVQEAMRTLREWNKGPFSENPYVLLSLALERAGCIEVSRTIFDGIVSFYELRSLLYNMERQDLQKLHNLIKALGEDVKAGLRPQQIYDALCRWKEKHNKGDQTKILRDALERADLSEAWVKITETRENTARVSEATMKHILLEIGDSNKIQQFIGKLAPGPVRHQDAFHDKDVIQQTMEILTEWNEGPFSENPMILLSRALEKVGCNQLDKTFFYGRISYFELWSLVHAYKDDMKTLCHALHALGFQDVHNAKTLDQVYVLLSKWKNQHHACDQLLVLKVLLAEAGLLKFCEDLHERRYRTDANISDDSLEHILWHLKYSNKIRDFLLELNRKIPEPGLSVSQPASVIIRAALDELKQWKKGPAGENPVVQLSLALERAKCTPVDRTFFKVPTYLIASIKDGEVEVFVHKLTSRHCRRLASSLPQIDEKRVLEISYENKEELFDTKSMISDWIASEECSNYEKRCKLDDAVIKIGRHDMTDLFQTVAHRRETTEDFTQPHPSSEYFNHDRIFDDDLISLTKLMSCLNEEIMSKFCTSVVLSDHVKKGDKEAVTGVLRVWRDSNLTSDSNGSLESVFSQITQLMGDKTYVNYVTNEELGIIMTQLKVDKKEKLLSELHIRQDKVTGKWIMKQKGSQPKQKLSESDCQDVKIGCADGESFSEKEVHEVETDVPNVKDEGLESVFVDLLKEWRINCGEKSCRKKLRAVLKTIGVEECIANKTPRKFMYKTELVQVAFNVLMRDVLPVIQALGINQSKVKKYRRQNPDLEKGSLSLLIQLCPETKQVQTYNRRDFLPVLLKLGYVDAAKSLHLDHEQSLCELSSIVSSLHKDKFPSFINQLGISSDELPERSGIGEEAYRTEVMRIWKSMIRPVPYHYRMHIVTALQAIGCRELANEVLSGHHRGSAATDDVIGVICCRLDREQTRRLCKLLKLKPDEEQKISTTKIVNWVSKWMDEYDPSPKVRKGKSWDKFQPRKHMNNELVKAGFYELANEIMRLEFSRF